MKAFKIKRGGKILDYRRSETLDLDKVKRDLSKEFEIIDIRQPGRHIIATINRGGKECILKLASTEGIGARTESEAKWNEEFNKYSKSPEFRVPRNIESGFYNGLYYLVVEKFYGKHLSTLRGENNIISENLKAIIGFSQHIQNLLIKVPNEDAIESNTPQEWFVQKTKSWYESLSPIAIKDYELNELLSIVKNGAKNLSEKPRHGDFTPWHIIKLENGGLGLIDGEHAHSHGVEYYDIAYFIQRVFSVINRPDQVEKIKSELKKNDTNFRKLRTVLASRAIGGFLDEFLCPVPNYEKAKEFADFVINLEQPSTPDV